MPFIERENRVTLSGDLNIGSVEIQDQDSGVRANVTMAGLAVDINDPQQIGNALSVNINSTVQLLNTTSLANSNYPMEVELECRGADCLIKQGGASITLDAVNHRIREDDWRLVTISGVDEAYFAVRQYGPFSGVLVATRIDRL